MSRDFIGSQQGRSFLKSPNRDRVTRMIRNDRIPQVNYMHVKLGFYEYCFTGQSVVSNIRYRKCRITTVRTSDGSTRVDVIDTGDGYIYPVVTTTNPSNIGWPETPFVASSPTLFTRTGSAFGLTQEIQLDDLEVLSGDSILAQSYTDIDGIEFEVSTVDGVEHNVLNYVRGPVRFRIAGSPEFNFAEIGLRLQSTARSRTYAYEFASNEGSRAEARLAYQPFTGSIPLPFAGQLLFVPYFICRLSKLKIFRTTTSLWTTDMPTDPHYSFFGMNPGIRSQVACDREHEMPDGVLYPPPKSLMTFRTIRPGRLATPIPPFVKDFLGGPVPTCF